MSLKRCEQVKENGTHCLWFRGKSKKSFKKLRNKQIRNEAKNINREHPLTNRYKGWAD